MIFRILIRCLHNQKQIILNAVNGLGVLMNTNFSEEELSNFELKELPKGHYEIKDLYTVYRFIIEEIEINSDIVEVGSYLGRSASNLIRAALDKHGGKIDFKIHCIDPFYAGEEPPAREVVAYEFFRNMLDLNIVDYVRVYPMTSLSFIESAIHSRYIKKISILHLDGSHIKEIVKQEIRWFGSITEEAIIMHDTDRDDVRSCFQDVKEVGFEPYIETDMMTIFKKNV